jgi:hypothetical protein
MPTLEGEEGTDRLTKVDMVDSDWLEMVKEDVSITWLRPFWQMHPSWTSLP